MPLPTFHLLSHAVQLAYTFERGTYLARRWEEENTVRLYHLPGEVFVELSYDAHTNRIAGLRAFRYGRAGSIHAGHSTATGLVSMPTAEEQVLADGILWHRPLTLASAVRAVLRAAGEYVPEEEEELLRAYADSINIDMVPDGFRYVSQDGTPLLGLGPLELYEEEGNPQLLTRCAVWYGAEALSEWRRRGGV